MPFTYFAHQVPVLPVKRRWPSRWDGLALVVGSILPDLYYATSGWLFGPFGLPLWTDGHRLDLLVQNCVVPGTIVTILLRRWTFPVLPLLLPGTGPFHLRDLWFVGATRHRWWVTAWSVAVGAVTHIVIDSVTHADGYHVLQLGGHVVGTAVGVWLLWRLGRERAVWAWSGRPGGPDEVPVLPLRARRGVLVALGAGVVASAVYGVTRLGDGLVPAFMASSCALGSAALFAGWVGRRLGTASPAAGDPLVE